MKLLNGRQRVLNVIQRDWLTIHALESVLLSFFKGGSTLKVQPIPLLPSPGPEINGRRRGPYPRR